MEYYVKEEAAVPKYEPITKKCASFLVSVALVIGIMVASIVLTGARASRRFRILGPPMERSERLT